MQDMSQSPDTWGYSIAQDAQSAPVVQPFWRVHRENSRVFFLMRSPPGRVGTSTLAVMAKLSGASEWKQYSDSTTFEYSLYDEVADPVHIERVIHFFSHKINSPAVSEELDRLRKEAKGLTYDEFTTRIFDLVLNHFVPL